MITTTAAYPAALLDLPPLGQTGLTDASMNNNNNNSLLQRRNHPLSMRDVPRDFGRKTPRIVPPSLYAIAILLKSSLDGGLLLRGSDGAVSGSFPQLWYITLAVVGWESLVRFGRTENGCHSWPEYKSNKEALFQSSSSSSSLI